MITLDLTLTEAELVRRLLLAIRIVLLIQEQSVLDDIVERLA